MKETRQIFDLSHCWEYIAIFPSLNLFWFDIQPFCHTKQFKAAFLASPSKQRRVNWNVVRSWHKVKMNQVLSP